MKYDYRKIQRLRDSGLTYKQIMEEVGCCVDTVRRALTDDAEAWLSQEREEKRRFRDRVDAGRETKKQRDKTISDFISGHLCSDTKTR